MKYTKQAARRRKISWLIVWALSVGTLQLFVTAITKLSIFDGIGFSVCMMLWLYLTETTADTAVRTVKSWRRRRQLTVIDVRTVATQTATTLLAFLIVTRIYNSEFISNWHTLLCVVCECGLVGLSWHPTHYYIDKWVTHLKLRAALKRIGR